MDRFFLESIAFDWLRGGSFVSEFHQTQSGLPDRTPVAVVMISLNEAHNMEAVLQNLEGWAQEVFLVDSCSSDDTVGIALRHGVHVVQRPFRGFGDQWNFAMRELPITAPWTMKLDPDERLSERLKESIRARLLAGDQDGLALHRRLWFIGAPLPVRQKLLRIWRTGSCRFTDVAVNEYPEVAGVIKPVDGDLEHHDSPDLEHWLTKQNRYTTAEAASQFRRAASDFRPRLTGGASQRRAWIKRHFWKVPGRYLFLYLFHLVWLGAWRAGRPGWIWARLRTEVYRMWEYKAYEMSRLGRVPANIPAVPGDPDPRVRQYE